MTEILIIDDDPYSMEILTTRLLHKGCTVLKATDGITGIMLADKHQPDMILLDLQLPDINGYEVLQRIRMRDSISHIPVIAISVDMVDRKLEKQTDEHFDNFLIKPVMADYLFESMAKSGIDLRTE